MTTTQPIVFNPLDPAFRANPYPIYERILAEDPVHMTPFGTRAFARHADCLAILRDPKRFSSDDRKSPFYQPISQSFKEEAKMPNSTAGVTDADRPFLFMDPPDHTRLRRLVNHAFSAKTVEAMRPRVQQIVDDLLEKVEAKGSFEAISDLSYPLPVAVICEMLGVPKEDQPIFGTWSEELAKALDPSIGQPDEVIQRRAKAVEDSRVYFRQLTAERRKNPGSDLISALLAAEEEGDKLSEGELLSTCTLLLIAGHETTVNLIGNGILQLLRHPDELARFRENPDLAPGVVEEVLRFDPPVQFDGRICLERAEVAGVTIEPGEFVMQLIGAANRDPAVFEDPSRFDITRNATNHIAFGYGIHFCLGAPLARLEGQIALRSVVQRFPNLHMETNELRYKNQITIRGLAELPLGF
jgi:pimeloyl-[acyl-carrier protein] synthase